jgi:hypothetical protein
VMDSETRLCGRHGWERGQGWVPAAVARRLRAPGAAGGFCVDQARWASWRFRGDRLRQWSYNLTFSLNFNNILNHTNLAIPSATSVRRCLDNQLRLRAASEVLVAAIRLTTAASTRRLGSASRNHVIGLL